jgi:glutamate decarboxylase
MALHDHGTTDTAFQIVHDELMLDGNARLNLATFVTTWMEPQARVLMNECAEKNMIDKDEYPVTAEQENRCVAMLADLWNADDAEHAMGCSTTGSSEAAMLAGLALKWSWRAARQASGTPVDRPNLVMGANVQVCWEKFCRYWDVEARTIPVGPDTTCLTAERAAAACDENTIGVVAILGSTFDGVYEPIAEICAALDGVQQRSGLEVPVHVDAASAGRGVGWVVWRSTDALPADLIFRVNYLGGDMPTFALNFSRPGAQVVAQYYNFLRLGRDGYTRVQQACRDTAQRIAGRLDAMAQFETVSRGDGVPVTAFRLRDGIDNYTVFDVSEGLRAHGWQVPAYTFPPDLEHVAVLRVVVRNGLEGFHH